MVSCAFLFLFGTGPVKGFAVTLVIGLIANAVEGWDPMGWRKLTDELSRVLSWTHPPIPWSTDPQPFEGAPLSA